MSLNPISSRSVNQAEQYRIVDATLAKDKPLQIGNITAASMPLRAAYHAGVCALASYAFSILTPGPAAVFGAASSIAQDIINPMLGHSQYDASVLANYFKTVAKSAFVYATASTLAAYCVRAVGVQISFRTAIQLTCAMYVTSCVITGLALACIGCLCCGCLAAFFSLADADTQPKKQV